jgi:hypothetical protein
MPVLLLQFDIDARAQQMGRARELFRQIRLPLLRRGAGAHRRPHAAGEKRALVREAVDRALADGGEAHLRRAHEAAGIGRKSVANSASLSLVSATARLARSNSRSKPSRAPATLLLASGCSFSGQTFQKHRPPLSASLLPLVAGSLINRPI